MNSSTRPVKASGLSTFERWPARGIIRLRDPRDAGEEPARADPEDEVHRAVDDQDRAAVGQQPLLEPAAREVPDARAAALREVAAGGDRRGHDGPVAAPEPGQRDGANGRLRGEAQAPAVELERQPADPGRLARRAGDDEARTARGGGRRRVIADVAAERQADDDRPAAGRLVDRADDAGGGLVERERVVRCVPCPGRSTLMQR